MVRQTSFYCRHGKRLGDLFVSAMGLVLLWPVFLVIAMVIRFDSHGPVLFRQRRVGKNGRGFWLYKFRTMVEDAESLKRQYLSFNEADGPVFKIQDDPRFTRVGKFLARTGFDELPQFVNVLRGEMSLVGPRPLPVDEAAQIPHSVRKVRERVLPGITSAWVVLGAHRLSFSEWMRQDRQYVEYISLFVDLEITLKTARMMAIGVFQLLSTNEG